MSLRSTDRTVSLWFPEIAYPVTLSCVYRLKQKTMPTPQTIRELNAFVARNTICDIEKVEFVSITVPDTATLGEAFAVLWATVGAAAVTVTVHGGTPNRTDAEATGACEVTPTALGVLSVTVTARSRHSSVKPVALTKKIPVTTATPTIWLSDYDLALTRGAELVLRWATQNASHVQLIRDGELAPHALRPNGALSVEIDDAGECFEFIATGATGETAAARCVVRALRPLAIQHPFAPSAAYGSPFSQTR